MSMPCDRCGGDIVGAQLICPHCAQPVRQPGAEANPAGAASRWPTIPPADHAILWDGAYSPRAAFPLWLLDAAAVVLVVGIAFPTLGFQTCLFLSLLTAALGVGGTALYVMFRRLTAHYTLTAASLACQSGFFVTICEELSVMDIDDVAFSQNRWERLVGVGTIKVMPIDRHRADFFLHGIRMVERVAGLIEDAGRAERRRLGLFIE